MCSKFSLSIVAVALLILPAKLIAGGPPRLCLPINNVTEQNAKDCSKQLSEFFGEQASGVSMAQHKGQWYATISLRQDVSLKAVHEALANSPFTVPRENLALIGSAVLSITVRTKYLEGFFGDLEQLKGLTIDDKSHDESELLVTINASKLCRNLNDGTRNEILRYDTVKALLEDHNAELTDIRWGSSWHCRGVFGCMVTPDANVKVTVANK